MLLFGMVMTSGAFLKKPLVGDDDLLGYVEQIELIVKNGDWSQADVPLQKGIRAWEKVKNRIQFSVERDFIIDIDNKLATIKGGIKAKDEKGILTTTEELRFVWSELGN